MHVCIDGGHGNGETCTCVQVRAATSMALIDDARTARAARTVNGVMDGQRGKAARAAGDERNDEQARAAHRLGRRDGGGRREANGGVGHARRSPSRKRGADKHMTDEDETPNPALPLKRGARRASEATRSAQTQGTCLRDQSSRRGS